MSFGSMPIGFRFYPTDQELVGYYLHQKIYQGNAHFIEEMDVYGCEPWSLSHETNPWLKKNEWYYFVRRTRGSVNINSKRPRRTVGGDGNGGTWKATDGEKAIIDQNNNILGYKRSLTFIIKEEGKKNGIKSDWVMKEYRLASSKFQEWVLCRIKYKPRHNNPTVQGTALAAQVPYGIRSEELGRNNDFQITPGMSNAMMGNNGGGPDMSNNIFGQNSGKDVPRLPKIEHPSPGGSVEDVDSIAGEVEARVANDPDGVSVDEIFALDPLFNYTRAVAMSMPFRSIDGTLSLVQKSLGDSLKVPYVKSEGKCGDLCRTKPISEKVHIRKRI